MTKNKRYILITILSIIITVITGTFAWLSYRSNDTAMLLIVGNFNDVRVTVGPYRFRQEIMPSLTYKSENDEDNIYSNVEAINNSGELKKVKLYYKVNKIDAALENNTDFKYTIEKSTNGTTFTEYYTGDFSKLTDGIVTVKEEILPNGNTYYYKVYIWLESNGNQNEVQGSSFDGELRAEFSDPEYNYAYDENADYQEFTAPVDGYYFIETWGAEGGTANSSYVAGKGGYTSGYIHLSANDTLYVYVGGQGTVTSTAVDQTAAGGYNGGGSGHNNVSGTGRIAGSGGGATDIRLVSGSWNDATSLNSRIMVAGGGAGSWYHSATYYGIGGDGGTLFGGTGNGNNNGTSLAIIGGGQVSKTSVDSNGGYNGSFGVGAGGGTGAEQPGAGGGYYGGNNTKFTASGGSSFISGFAGVNAINSSRSHTNNTLHYSEQYFIDGAMTAGVNEGAGKAKITYVGDAPERVNTDLNNVRYIKDCINGNTVNTTNSWNEIQAIKNGVNVAYGKSVTTTGTLNTTASGKNYSMESLVDGDLWNVDANLAIYETGFQCVTVDLYDEETGQTNYNLDEIAVWHMWTKEDGRAYNNNITYVSSDGTNWVPIMTDQSVETSQGKRVNVWEENETDVSNALTINYAYTENYQTFTAPISGYYIVEAWGAQGGTYSTYVGGKGGYTSGYTYLTENEKLYIYVGGQGKVASSQTAAAVAGGYNGGGSAYGATDKYVTGGGGASDVRLVGGDWDDATSLNSRIMVAAGGGGSSFQSSTAYGYGGAGGGLVGSIGTVVGTNYLGQGGTQTAGGANGYTNSTVSGFGIGGGTTSASGTGGGSGYYGGGAGRWYNGGAGGSSFISGFAGVNAIDSSRNHTNNTLHYSNKYFTDNEMTPNVNSGDGKVKITHVGELPERVNTDLNNVRFIKDCMNGNTVNSSNHWVEIQAIKNGLNVAKGKNTYMEGGETEDASYPFSRITDGIVSDSWSAPTDRIGFQCVIIDLYDSSTGTTHYDLDEIAVWHYYSDGRTYYNNVTFVSSDAEEWIPVIADQEAETCNGKRVNAWENKTINLTTAFAVDFAYTSISRTFDVPLDGYYKVETWGAQGGSGAKGGYTSGYIRLNAADKLYVYVGGSGPTTAAVTNVGGWNGGGYSGNNSSAYSYGGGGATDIRLVGGTWNDATSLNSRIMVAAGGGGSFKHNSNTYTITPGIGGNLIGSNGGGSFTDSAGNPIDPTGGTQTSGGIGGKKNETVRDGSFGFSQQSNTSGFGGGGGGGYYGGGTGYGRGGAGGSSFISGFAGVNAINSSRNHTNNTLHYSNKYFVNNTMTGGNNSGNGKAKITYVGEALEKVNTNLNNVRYIKDCSNGNNQNTHNFWGEIQAIKSGINLALNKTVSGTSVGYNDSNWSYSYITDGLIDNITSTGGLGYSQNDGEQCVTIDLGQIYDLDEIAVWHYWNGTRITTDNVTYVSSDNTNWIIVIMNNDVETSNGKRVNAWSVAGTPTVSASVDSTYHITGTVQNLLTGVASYCINTSALDTSGCTWISHNSTSITSSEAYPDGTYYIHVKDSNGNIIHSNSATVVTSTLAITYTGKYKVCTGSSYSSCTTKTNASYSTAETTWKVFFLTSGTLNVSTIKSKADVFLVGGGGAGARWRAGGGGGYTKTQKNITINTGTNYTITVGAGGTANSTGTTLTNGGTSSAFGYSAAGGKAPGASSSDTTGGNGGSGGGAYGYSQACVAAGSNGGNGTNKYFENADTWTYGGTGQGTTTREFGDSSGTLYAGGGAGAKTNEEGTVLYSCSGGSGGGGGSGRNGTANTGGGAGGGWGWSNATWITGDGSGGSGIVVIRKHV